MSTNEIKALQQKLKEEKQKIKSLLQPLEKVKLQISYAKLLLRQKKLQHYIVTNKIPKRDNCLVMYKYAALFTKEILLLNIKFGDINNTSYLLFWINRVLKEVYKVDNICLCIKEEDILPLSPFISEEDFIESENGNFYPLLSEIFTHEKLIDIDAKLKYVIEKGTDLKELATILINVFSAKERIERFSPEVNFIGDITIYSFRSKRDSLTYQTSLNIDPTLFHNKWFKDYIGFLEGKIDPGIHTELYLTYCQ